MIKDVGLVRNTAEQCKYQSSYGSGLEIVMDAVPVPIKIFLLKILLVAIIAGLLILLPFHHP